MPKDSGTPANIVPKQEPYDKRTPQKGRAPPITWTEQMDKAMISHVLSRSEIRFNFDWAALKKSTFPDLSISQISNHWEKKVRRSLIPDDVLKKSKQAKGARGPSQG